MGQLLIHSYNVSLHCPTWMHGEGVQAVNVFVVEQINLIPEKQRIHFKNRFFQMMKQQNVSDFFTTCYFFKLGLSKRSQMYSKLVECICTYLHVSRRISTYLNVS